MKISNRPLRGALARLADRVWPHRWRVYYGPNRGAGEYRALGAYAWGCGRCRGVGGYATTREGVWTEAVAHAAGSRWLRAVYDEG